MPRFGDSKIEMSGRKASLIKWGATFTMALSLLVGCQGGGTKEERQGPVGAESPRQGQNTGGSDTSNEEGGSGGEGGANEGGGIAEEPPCQEGATRFCHVDLGTHNGVTSCFEGIETCVDGEWGNCSDAPADNTEASNERVPVPFTGERASAAG